VTLDGLPLKAAVTVVKPLIIGKDQVVMLLLLSGLGLMIAMQVVIFCVALKNAPPQALLCLVIPLYVYVYAKRDSQAKIFLWAWYLGVVLLAAGVIATG
jgi:hypothetical protein